MNFRTLLITLIITSALALSVEARRRSSRRHSHTNTHKNYHHHTVDSDTHINSISSPKQEIHNNRNSNPSYRDRSHNTPEPSTSSNHETHDSKHFTSSDGDNSQNIQQPDSKRNSPQHGTQSSENGDYISGYIAGSAAARRKNRRRTTTVAPSTTTKNPCINNTAKPNNPQDEIQKEPTRCNDVSATTVTPITTTINENNISPENTKNLEEISLNNDKNAE